MMRLKISQFAHPGLWKVYDGLTPNPPPIAEHERCFRVLTQLAIARHATDLLVPVRCFAGGYAIDVMRVGNRTSRITYQWANGRPERIDYEG